MVRSHSGAEIECRLLAMGETFRVRQRQRGGLMVHRPECHETTDVVATELRRVTRRELTILAGPQTPCRKSLQTSPHDDPLPVISEGGDLQELGVEPGPWNRQLVEVRTHRTGLATGQREIAVTRAAAANRRTRRLTAAGNPSSIPSCSRLGGHGERSSSVNTWLPVACGADAG
jgi:hypothetical protein